VAVADGAADESEGEGEGEGKGKGKGKGEKKEDAGNSGEQAAPAELSEADFMEAAEAPVADAVLAAASVEANSDTKPDVVTIESQVASEGAQSDETEEVGNSSEQATKWVIVVDDADDAMPAATSGEGAGDVELAAETNDKQVVKVPHGFRRKDAEWYHSEQSQYYWNSNNRKFYVWDPAEQKHIELYEDGATSLPDYTADLPDYCIEDMCSEDMRLGSLDEHNEELGVVREVSVEDLNLPLQPGCSEQETHSRALVSAVVQAYHGSTALEEVFMSSQQVATLCTCKSWQCEAYSVDGLGTNDAWSWNYNAYLETLGGCWDLSKKVFFQKFMVPHDCDKPSPAGATHGGEHCQTAALETFDYSIASASVPPIMQSAGIHRLNRAYLLLWRPLCLTILSTHAKRTIEHSESSRTHLMEQEVHFLQEVRNTYDYLDGRQPVMVISLASLIWEPDRNQQRLQQWLPCMGPVDMGFVPQMNIDIFPENRFKADGSVKAYGESISPSAFYNVARRECTDYSLLDGVDDDVRQQGMDVSAFLSKLS